MTANRRKNLSYVGVALIAYLAVTYLLYLVEHGNEGSNINTPTEAFWYTIVTLSTVGYGDYYPTTGIGKVIGLIFVLGSVGILGYLISQLTAQVSVYLEKKRLGLLGTKFTNHILVIGWDKFGKEVVEEVVHSGNQVAIVCNDKSEIDLIHEAFGTKEVFALFTDYSNLEALEKANIQDAATVFINFPDDTEVLIYLLNLKKSYPDLNYVVSLSNPSLKETFAATGVRYVVSKTEIASRLVASYTFEPDVAMMAESLMTSALEGEDYDLLEYRVTEQNPYAGEDYLDAFISLKKEHDCVLVGINQKQSDGSRLLKKNPSAGLTISRDDYLILICTGTTKNKMQKLFGVSEGRLQERGAKQKVE
ncbi:MAG: potassium channel family protein [Tunicatimonas sp.]|uniref:potassium channel family protein n=1 Tax=Tunicatimonas sp. TaxID=1940096 RepID=UPI003C72DD97